jgi:hypothetical protein
MKDFISRKRDMEKKTDSGIRHSFTEEPGKEHQMIIVDPNDIILLGYLRNGIAKMPVGAFIAFVVCLVIRDILGEIMKQGPDGLITKTVIVVVDFALRKKDRLALEFRAQALCEDLLLIPILLIDGDPRPPDPEAII